MFIGFSFLFINRNSIIFAILRVVNLVTKNHFLSFLLGEQHSFNLLRMDASTVLPYTRVFR